MDLRRLPTALVAVLLVAGCSTGLGGGSSSWRQLPEPPLSPRVDAVLVGLDGHLLVVGGSEFTCPPNADCSESEDPLLDDGALYDVAADAWRTTAAPPFGLVRQDYATAALDGTAYLLTTCATGPRCDAPARLLSYRVAEDAWTDHGPVPGPVRTLRITAFGEALVVYTDSTALGRAPDLLFDPARSAWTELPADPLPPVDDRFLAPAGDQLVLTGSAIAEPGSLQVPPEPAARFDAAAGAWLPLPEGPRNGRQLFPTARGPLLAGPFGAGDTAWLLDPGTWTWTEQQVGGDAQAGVSGALDADRATFDLANTVGGWSYPVRVYDSVADAFLTIPRPPDSDDVYGESSTGLGRDLVVHGGQRWSMSSDAGDGDLVGDAWLWTAPTG